jgi:hypothetical protein
MFSKTIRLLLSVFLVCGISVLAGYGQGLTSVTGTVTDSTDAVVPGVEVTITNTATGAVRSVLTNEIGIYAATQLQPGTYSIKADLTGFQAQVFNNVALPVNQTVMLNMKLQVGTVADLVEVTASAETVNTVNAQLGVGFDQKKIIDLPLDARNIVGLLGLQSGVQASNTFTQSDGTVRDDGGQVNGARNDQQNIVLDGVDVNAQLQGSAFQGALPTTLDSVQEFIVQTSGQGGQAARSSGAQVQLVTKSGSNNWHGSGYEFYRTTGTSARNYFAKEATPLIRHLPGGSLGGPILKDKLFFFGAYERQSDRSGQLVKRNVPTPQFLNGTIRYRRKDGSFGTITTGCGSILEAFTQIPCDTVNPALLGPNGGYQAYAPFSNDASRTSPGQDVGANFLFFAFNAPFIRTHNVYISRVDYNLNPNNTVYVRGTLNGDNSTLGPEKFPGLNNGTLLLDNSKGFAASWNSVISSTLNSNFTAGLTRQAYQFTGAAQAYYSPDVLTNLLNTNGAESHGINTWNFVENLSWLKGAHNVQAGANFRYVFNHLSSFQDVPPPVYSAPANLTAGGVGTGSSAPLLRALGAAEYANVADPGIVGSAILAATGMVTQFADYAQFDVHGHLLPVGTPLIRDIRLNEYNYYLQDSWKLRSNFTLNYGLNYGIVTPPWERNGTEVNWMQNLGARYREQKDTTKFERQLGLLQTQVAGRANGLPDYYPTPLNDWAPRASFAWTPGGKWAEKGGALVVRGGYAMTYDHTGGRMGYDAARVGSIGLVTNNQIQTNSLSVDGVGKPRAPRITSLTGLPRNQFPFITDASFTIPPAAGSWGGPSNLAGIDSYTQNPRNHQVNLTVSKELPGGFVVEASYIGRYARQLIGQVDMASPVNVRDPKSGMTYYDAVKTLYENYENKGVAVANVQPIPWFENIYTGYKKVAGDSMKQTFNSETQAIYAYANIGITPGPNAEICWTNALDFYESSTDQNIVTNPQATFFGFYSNLGLSNYHAGQFTVRKRFTEGYTFTANYTWSKSMDITSQAEARGNRANGTTGEGLAEDAYHPSLSYAISDFNRTSQFNGNFLAELPFGKGKPIAGNASGVLNTIIGGWEVSGIALATTGRPWNFTSSNRFTFHFFGRDVPALATNVPWGLNKQKGGVYLIQGSAADRDNIAATGFQNVYPGSAVARNQGVGPNFFNIDAAISKAFQVREGMSMRLRAEAFNALNHPNFSIPFSQVSSTNGLNISRRGGVLGQVLDTQGTERTMQFSMRVVF